MRYRDNMRQMVSVVSVFLTFASITTAGVHYSGETWADLPAQWPGYLADYRSLRALSVTNAALPSPPLKNRYLEERKRLESLTRKRAPDESADLGAIYIRLGEPEKAIELLRAAHADVPDHFRIIANLGSAYQLVGELDQAVHALELAVRLAPPRWKKAEQLHLALVRQRRTEQRQTTSLDQLFDVKYAGATSPPPGLPNDAVSQLQTLALWLPTDGRLLWQLGELAFAHGDVAIGAAILDGCVTEFGMNDPALRKHRQEYRVIADKWSKNPPASKSEAASAHAGHRADSIIRFKSPRPLIRDPNQLVLSPIQRGKLNQLPWNVLAETSFERPFRVAFHEHLLKLEGERVVITGFMQPISDGLEQPAVLLLEFPVGCWYCESPELTGLILVEAPKDRPIAITRELVRIEGKLKLNAKDAEDYLYTITDAKSGPVD